MTQVFFTDPIHPAAYPLFIVGDFNARLRARMGQNEFRIGPHVFERGLNFLLDGASSTSLENRSLFVEFRIAHDLHIGNTLEAGANNGPPYGPLEDLPR